MIADTLCNDRRIQRRETHAAVFFGYQQRTGAELKERPPDSLVAVLAGGDAAYGVEPGVIV